MLPLTASAWTGPSIPEPRANHALPFHFNACPLDGAVLATLDERDLRLLVKGARGDDIGHHGHHRVAHRGGRRGEGVLLAVVDFLDQHVFRGLT